MEETKEAKAAKKEASVMEEARSKCKKYSTEALVGKLLLAGLDLEVITASGRDELINYTLTVEGFDVGVTLPKKKETELDPMQMMMKMMIEENKRRDEENKRREDKREEERREEKRLRDEEKREEKRLREEGNKRRDEENKRREEEKREDKKTS